MTLGTQTVVEGDLNHGEVTDGHARGHRVRLARRRHGGAGREDFKHPGWTFAFDRGDDGNDFKLQETLETDVLLLGRKTESFAGAWPDREGPCADKFNTMPKYVVSSTLGESEWDNTTGAARRCRRRGHEGEVADVRGSILVRPHQR